MMITSLIAKILKGLYADKANQISAKLQPKIEELAEEHKRIEQKKADINQRNDNPEMILLFKKHGIDISNWPRHTMHGKLSRENNLLFKDISKKIK